METKEQKAPRAQQVDAILQSETKRSLAQRQWTLLAVLALYVLLGLPLWLSLTEIYRAPLPSNFIATLSSNGHTDVHVCNSVFLSVGDGLRFSDLAEAAQVQVDHELHKLRQGEQPLSVLWDVSLRMADEHTPKDAYILRLELGAGEGVSLDETRREATLFYTLESVKNNDLPFFVAQTVLHHLFSTEMALLRLRPHDAPQSTTALRYSPNVHLSFKLLTGDGSPVDWEMEQALNTFFRPLVRAFKSYVNFTIDSEIKYFTELNLPQGRSNNSIDLAELSTVMDFAEWDVASNQYSYPTLNFILYFPSMEQSPLSFVQDKQGGMYNSFLIPQWGSVILMDTAIPPRTVITTEELEPLLETFTAELFKLLAIPQHPKTPQIRIDAMKKFSTLQNLSRGVQSLASLLKLSESLPNMSIPRTVLHNVQCALSARQASVDKLTAGDFDGSLVESNTMVRHAELAFFDREMVQQNFFPQEHKIAVYMPLLGPLTLICVLAIMRVLNEWKLYRTK